MTRQDSEEEIEIANMLQSLEVEQSRIDEIVALIKDNKRMSSHLIYKNEESESLIKLKMADETDWKKKASLAAMLISRSLDN